MRNIDEKYLAYEIYGMDLKLQLQREKFSKISMIKFLIMIP